MNKSKWKEPSRVDQLAALWDFFTSEAELLQFTDKQQSLLAGFEVKLMSLPYTEKFS